MKLPPLVLLISVWLVVAGLHLFLLRITQFTPWPEMLLYPWLLDQGMAQYRDIIHPYVPGLIWILYGWFEITGYTVWSLKMFSWSVVVLLDGMVLFFCWKICRRVWSSLIVLLWFVIWQVSLGGNGLWFDLAITPLVLLAFYGLVAKRTTRWTMAAGLALGFSLMIKQSAVWFVAAALVTTLMGEKRFFRTLQLSVPILIISMSTALLVSAQGLWSDFWFWAVLFPFTFVEGSSGHQLFPSFRDWLIVGVVFSIPLFLLLWNKSIAKRQKALIVVWIVAGLMMLYPRFDWLHMQPVLAILSLVLALSLKNVGWVQSRKAVYVLALLLLGSVFVSAKMLVLRVNLPDRFVDDQLKTMAEHAEEHYPGKSFAVVNGPQLLHWYLDTPPVKPWADTFSWYLEVPGLQQRMVSSWRDEHVAVIITEMKDGEDYSIERYYPEKVADFIQTYYRFDDLVGGYEVWVRL